MQPYSYPRYPYPSGATMPSRFMAPANYQQGFPPFVQRAGAPRPLHPTQYAQQPLRYQPGYPAPGLPPPPMSTMMPMVVPQNPQPYTQFQPSQGFYYNSNGLYGINPDESLASTVPKKGGKANKNKKTTIPPNQIYKTLTSNPDVHALLDQKGTKVKVSKIYKIRKTKPNMENESSDDEFEQIPLDSPLPRAMPVFLQTIPVQPQRLSSASSSCSSYSDCSCPDCRNPKPRHARDDCSECRAIEQHKQARRKGRK